MKPILCDFCMEEATHDDDFLDMHWCENHWKDAMEDFS